MNADAPALRCSGLVHVYTVAGTDVAALRGIDLVVQRGQRVALLGPSGSGKSTLLSIVSGVMRPSAGRAEVFGTDLVRATPRRMRRLRRESLGLMLQGAATNLLLFEDAEGNVDYAVHGTRRGDRRLGARVLAEGGIARDRRPIGAMSPSEQQVVALAVAMATRPALLLVDEPTSRLDDAARDRLLDLLVSVSREHGTAVLVVTHDEQVAERMDRMIHLRDGRIADEATSAGRFAIVGADGSVRLPDEFVEGAFGPGALLRVEGDGPGRLVVELMGADPDAG